MEENNGVYNPPTEAYTTAYNQPITDDAVQRSKQINRSRALTDTWLWQLLNPGAQQEREYGQQVAFQREQNDWNSAQNQMARAKAAGINPNTMASQISGQSQGVDKPNTAVASGEAAADSIVGAGSAVGSLLNGAGNFFDKFALFGARAAGLRAGAAKDLSIAGFTDEQKRGVIIDNKYKEENAIADLNIKHQQFDNMYEEFKILQQQWKEYDKKLEWFDRQMISTLNMQDKQAMLSEKLAFESEQRKTIMVNEEQFWQDYGFGRDSNVDVSLRNLWYKCYKSGDFTDYKAALEDLFYFYEERSYRQQKGYNDSEIDSIFEKTWNEFAAKYDMENRQFEYQEQLKSFYNQLNELFKANLTFHGGGNPVAFLSGIMSEVRKLIANIEGTYTNLPPRPASQDRYSSGRH